MKRRIVSVLMALVMALSLLPVQALAEDAAVEEPVTEIKQAEQTGKGEEPGDPEEQTGEGEEPGDPEEEQEPGEPEEPVREFVQGEAQLTVSTAAMAAGTAGERTVPSDFYEALNVGGSLTMQNDVDYGKSMWVSRDLTIDLNGYVLKMNGIKVEKGVHLTIRDSRPDAEHKFTPNDDGLWVRDEQNGTKTVKGGVIYGGTGSSIGTSVYGGGVYVEGGGQFTMEGGNIVGCTASATFQARGGGVYVAEKGTFTMSGGSIAGCTTVGGYSYGGGIYNEGTVNLSGTAEIRDCHAKDSDGEAAFGGGISDNGEAFQISGNVRITGCTASGGGTDAVSMYTGSVISGGTFDGSVQNTGTISGGNEYRYHEDKTPVPQWGAFTSTKLKYFTRDDTGVTVPAYCMEPSVRSASGDLSYSSTSWSSLSWNQRYAVTLALSYGYGGNYDFYGIHPDCAQLATQAVIWEFVCGYRGTTYPYTLYDTTCANLFHYAGDGVQEAYDILIDRIMGHGVIPSFAVKYRNQLSDANAITLTWDGSQYVGTATDTNGVLSQYYFRTNISGVTVSQRRNVLTVTATKDAAAQLNGYISSDYGYSLDVEGTESVLLEPSNDSNYQACAALTSLPDPVWAYIHFKVNIVEEKGSITVRKVDVTGSPLAGAELLLETSADGKTWSEEGRVTTDNTGIAKWSDLKVGAQYRITETRAPAGYTLLTEPLFTGTLDSINRDVTITACNNADFVLPFTGGRGFAAPILFAALMLGMGVYFCKKSEFKKENN